MKIANVIRRFVFEEWGGIRGWLTTVSNGIFTLTLKHLSVKDIIFVSKEACSNGRLANNPCEIRHIDIQHILEMLL